MHSTVDLTEVERTVDSILPDEGTRRVCLGMLLEAIYEANECGRSKWGVYFVQDRVRLLVGNLIVHTLQAGKVWLALDQQLLEGSNDERRLLELSNSWQWDVDDYPEYVQVPSRNGYYTPADNHEEVWPILRDLHFAFIRRTAHKYKSLNVRSQAKHTPELLEYLSIRLDQQVPEPAYWSLVDTFKLPEEIPDDVSFFEGTRQRVTVNAYERSPKARQECIAYYGTSCFVCGFDFARVYGGVGEGFIHVHHLTPLAEIGAEYEVNPIKDLRPVCPNCHAMIHKRNPPYSVEEIMKFLKAPKSQDV